MWDSTTFCQHATLLPGHASGVGHLSFSNEWRNLGRDAPNSSEWRVAGEDRPSTMQQNRPIPRAASPQKGTTIEDGGFGVGWAVGGMSRTNKRTSHFESPWWEGGRFLVSVGTDTFHSIVLWDLQSCVKIAAVFGSRDLISAVTFGTQNQTVVTCGNGHIKFWEIPCVDPPKPVAATPWNQLKGRAAAAPRTGGEAVLVGWKGKLPISYEQEKRGLPISATSEVVLTSAISTPSGLVTGSHEGMIYLWDEERRETVQAETCKAHTGSVLHLALWGSDGMVSGGQDGAVILWKCGELPANARLSYGHITQVKKVYIRQIDSIGNVQLSSTCSIPLDGNPTAGEVGGMIGVHSVSCNGDEILLGTRCAKLLVLDVSAENHIQKGSAQDTHPVDRSQTDRMTTPTNKKMGWADQLRAARAAKDAKERACAQIASECSMCAAPLEKQPESVPTPRSKATDVDFNPLQSTSPDTMQVRARLLADGALSACGQSGVSVHSWEWSGKHFFKVLHLAESGQVTLRKGARAQSLSVLAGFKASCVAFLPAPISVTSDLMPTEPSTEDPVLEKARGLLKQAQTNHARFTPKKKHISPSKSGKDIEVERDTERRRSLIAAQVA